ncbi:MAG: DUF3486 family protein [Ruminococcus sp.]|nr:DUF3486 family protein [Ruminococcus sp.]
MTERKRHFKIEKLPADIKSQVDEMIAANFTYDEIVDFIQSESDMTVSPMAVCRYARSLRQSIQTLRMAQENFRVLMDEVNKYPTLDTGEAILRLLSHVVVDRIQNTSDDKWKELGPDELIKQSTALVKAAAYKKNLDVRNEDIMSAGFEQVKGMVFEAMSRERPELYAEVAAFLEQKRGESV